MDSLWFQQQTAKSMSKKRSRAALHTTSDKEDCPPRKKRRFNDSNQKNPNQTNINAIHPRYTHFLSIRITNASIIALAKQIKDEIKQKYENDGITINTSLINEAKYHVSLNILSAPNEQSLNAFCNVLNAFSKWLKIDIFDEDIDINTNNKVQDEEIFLRVIRKRHYTEKFKDLYDKITSNKLINDNGKLPFYIEGANHFRQQVVFLDFEHKCDKMQSKQDQKNEHKSTRNELVLALLNLIYKLVADLCDECDIKCDKKKFVPHCTLMKVSKMKHYELQKLKEHNRNNNSDKLSRNEEKRYHLEILSEVLNGVKFETNLKSMKGKDYENIMNIDLCSMRGVSKDGYYKTVLSFSIVP